MQSPAPEGLDRPPRSDVAGLVAAREGVDDAVTGPAQRRGEFLDAAGRDLRRQGELAAVRIRDGRQPGKD